MAACLCVAPRTRWGLVCALCIVIILYTISLRLHAPIVAQHIVPCVGIPTRSAAKSILKTSPDNCLPELKYKSEHPSSSFSSCLVLVYAISWLGRVGGVRGVYTSLPLLLLSLPLPLPLPLPLRLIDGPPPIRIFIDFDSLGVWQRTCGKRGQGGAAAVRKCGGVYSRRNL